MLSYLEAGAKVFTPTVQGKENDPLFTVLPPLKKQNFCTKKKCGHFLLYKTTF